VVIPMLLLLGLSLALSLAGNAVLCIAWREAARTARWRLEWFRTHQSAIQKAVGAAQIPAFWGSL
jgi:hypothetical protein